jgi:DNA-binding CsgD family transcriptional regulator
MATTIRHDDRLLALFEATDLQALIDACFRVLQGSVRCDFVSAFYRTSRRGLLRERDSLGRQWNPAFMRRYLELSPAIPIALSQPGLKVLSTTVGIPEAEEIVRSSDFYNEIMRVQGWRHAVATCFWTDPPGRLPVFVASVYRRDGRRDFSKADLQRLERIHPVIACAVERLHDREKTKSVREALAVTGRDGNRGLAVLDLHLRLVESNSLFRRLSREWNGNGKGEKSRWQLPAELSRACRNMRSEWESAVLAKDDPLAFRRTKIVHPRLQTLSASVAMVCRSTDALAEPTFVVEVVRRSPRPAVSRSKHPPILDKLTKAERSVAVILADGLSNQEIADRLSKSLDAVKFLLHRIYKKTGVAGRAALVARLRL